MSLDGTDQAPYSSAVTSIPIDRLAKDAVPDYGVDTDAMKAGLSQVARDKVAATTVASDRQLSAMEGNYAGLKSKFDGISPVDVKPWNADQEREDRVRPPLEAFGSAAGIFAMIASAFTKTPMDSALNAGAAAINAERANDINGYDQAHTAWKENTDLALKRHEVERQAFKDAEELYKNDPIAGGAELKAVAARFGAKAELSMIDAGYVPEVFKIQEAKSKAAQQLIQQLPALTKMDETARVTMLGQQAIQDEQKRLGRPLDATEQAKTIGNVRRLFNQNMGTFTAGKQEALAIQDRADELQREAQGRGENLSAPQAYARAAQEVGAAKTHMTGNQVDKLRGHVDQFDLSLNKIDGIEKVIESKVGAVGLASRPLRLKERVENILGGNSTERVQMMRDLEYLRLNGARLLSDSSARPLAAEAARINTIIAGLESGDTGANTLRALEELKTLYSKMRQTTLSRISGTWKPEGGAPSDGFAAPASGGSAPATTPQRAAPWENDPVLSPGASSAISSGDEGRVVSDADEDVPVNGQRYAQNSPQFQISPQGNGQYKVIDIRTGQVRYSGSLDGARNAQASLGTRR